MADTTKTIEEKLSTVKTSLSNIKTSIVNKGQTPSGDITTYATAIDNISTGITPTGTISITENGTHDVTNYASAEVNVASSGGVQYIPREVTNGVLQYPSTYFTFSLPNDITSIGDFGLRSSFCRCYKLTSVNLSNVTSISEEGLCSAFQDCLNLTSVDLSNLTDIGPSGLSNTFNDCRKLTLVNLSNVKNVGSSGLSSAFNTCSTLESVDLSNVVNIDQLGLHSTFYACSNLVSIDLRNLKSIGKSGFHMAFYNCSNLVSVNLSNVSSIDQSGLTGAFQGCTKLTSLSFPALNTGSFTNSYGSYTNQFSDMLRDVTGCTVHFPCALEDVIGSWSDVINGFGGTDTIILFDLNSATIHFDVTKKESSDTIKYYIGGKEVANDKMVGANDTSYLICDSNYNTVVFGDITNLKENETRNITKNLATAPTREVRLNTGVEDCTVTLDINNVQVLPCSQSGSNYCFNLCSDNSTDIIYTVKKKGYKKVTGVITFNNEDIVRNITMTNRYIEVELQSGNSEYGWQKATVENPTSYTMLESANNGGSSSKSVMKILFNGYSSLTCYINSYAGSSSYTIVSKLDASGYPTSYSDVSVMASTFRKQYDPTVFDESHWTSVTFTPEDTGEHYFYVVFTRGSRAGRNNRGYFIINEDQ